MQALLDSIWLNIVSLLEAGRSFLDLVFSPLNTLGPALAIALVALVTVVITKVLRRLYKTRRHQELERQFLYWFNLRQEAMKCEDREKGKMLAKNIDQAKLNQVYYDYFFEGLMKSLATTCLPILIFLAYINETYRAAELLRLFGRDYILKINDLNGQTIVVGAGLWFVISVVLIYLGWFSVRRVYSRYVGVRKGSPEEIHQASVPRTH